MDLEPGSSFALIPFGLDPFFNDELRRVGQPPDDTGRPAEARNAWNRALEINPRFPAWVFLTVGSNRNLPWATVRLALGEEVEPLPPPEPGILFLRHSYDQICKLSDYEALTTLGQLTRAEVSP